MAAAAEAASSIASHCEICSVSAAIDRIMRAAGASYIDPARVLSVVLGRELRPSDIKERAARVTKARDALNRLLRSPGIPQRTPPWYAARKDLITASDIAQALGCAKFGTQKQFFEKKCGYAPEAPFDATLPPLRWGIMFEPVASALYARLNCDVDIHEFGLLLHPTVDYLGASPDGITADGVMLEIKCPWRRKVGGEVPLQYYYQIQGQLLVCGLDECDYFECEFTMSDLDSLRRAEADGEPCIRGALIEVVHNDGRPPSYRYPLEGGMGMTLDELRSWADREVAGAEGVGAGAEGVGAGAGADGADGAGADGAGAKGTEGAGAAVGYAAIRWWSLVKSHTVRVSADRVFAEDMVSRSW